MSEHQNIPVCAACRQPHESWAPCPPGEGTVSADLRRMMRDIPLTDRDLNTLSNAAAGLEHAERTEARLREEVGRLRSALVDLNSWFDHVEVTPPHYRIRAGERGADDAIAAARRALDPTQEGA